MIIDCIGCLHGARPKLEGGDLLIVTGDLTARDTLPQHSDVLEWLHRQDYKKKVLVGGNHDHFLEKNPNFYSKTSIDYLFNSGTEFTYYPPIEGKEPLERKTLKIWGMPWSAWFKGINPKCTAFTYKDEMDHYDEHIEKIPHDLDILITHEPAYGILDGIPQEDGSLFHVGSKGLYSWLKYVERPKLHVFSHIHEAHGQEEHFPTYEDKMMISVNCSIMDERYRPINKPVRIIL